MKLKPGWLLRRTLEVSNRENLLDQIVTEVQNKVAGENLTIRAIALFKSMQWVKNHQGASSNLLLNEDSGAGKDYVTDKVLELFPQDSCLKYEKMSPQAIAYAKSKYKNWTWDGKSLYLTEVNSNTFNDTTFIAFTAHTPGKSFKTIVVKDQQENEITVNGKPVIICTSASLDPKFDLLRRFTFWNLDLSGKQTADVLDKQTALMDEFFLPNEQLRKTLEENGSCEVIVPFSRSLLKGFTKQFKQAELPIVLRSKWKTMLDLICASAVLNQKYRQKDHLKRLMAETEDYENCIPIFERIIEDGLIPLTKDEKRLLAAVELSVAKRGITLQEYDGEKGDKSAKISEIQIEQSMFSEYNTLKNRLFKLQRKGYLDQGERYENNRLVVSFKLAGMSKIKIPGPSITFKLPEEV